MPLVDERTFENTVPLSEEQKNANIEYFRQKGMDIEYTDGTGLDTTEAPPAPAKTEDTPAPPDTAPAPEAPAAEPRKAVASEPEPPPLDAESEAEWQSATNDGEKKSRWAKRTQQLKNLRAENDSKTAKIEELEKLLKGKNEAPAPPPVASPNIGLVPTAPAPAAPGPAAAPPEPAKPAVDEALKPKEFDKPRPVAPKLEDFKDSDDPYAALLEAKDKHTEELLDWRDEKKAFEANEKERIAAEQKKVEAQSDEIAERQRAIETRMEEGRKAHAEFDQLTSRMACTPIMRYLINEELPDGMELAYQLARPEHADTRKAIFELTKDGEKKDPKAMGRLLTLAAAEFGAFRKDLSRASAAPAPVKTEPAPPAPPAPVATPTPTPPAPPPRREEAAPMPVRGRSVETLPDPKDMDPWDSDARRAVRRARGEL